MNKTIAAIIVVGALLVRCATPSLGPTVTPSRGALAPVATTGLPNRTL